MSLAAARNALATLGRLEKSLERCGGAQGEQLEGELKAAVEELDTKKAAFALAKNELPRRRATSRCQRRIGDDVAFSNAQPRWPARSFKPT